MSLKLDIKGQVLRVDDAREATEAMVHKYDAFLNLLCSERFAFQRDAVRETCRFLVSDQYPDLTRLARENWNARQTIQQRHESLDAYLAKMPLRERKAVSLDLATGTGKSYVMYALAAIALAEGLVDRVLVLCPSLTIEEGLLEKFTALAGNAELSGIMRELSAAVTIPAIKRGNETVRAGEICIENIHAVYENAGSSIADSFHGQGARTLVLNDEAHHLFSPPDKGLKEWLRFLLHADYGERLKPISIIVTQEIARCVEVWRELVDFLAKQERISRQDAAKKVIWVTSGVPSGGDAKERVTAAYCQRGDKDSPERQRKENLASLRDVDDPASPVEWIVSVSMLTEGWDVKNVFQIVPHESRAFNSKLLIAQVLGRGLRVPPGLDGQPLVTINNHEAWSEEVGRLLQEILEVESTLSWGYDPRRSKYVFPLHNLRYEPEQTTVESKRERAREPDVKFVPQDKSTMETMKFSELGNMAVEIEHRDFIEVEDAVKLMRLFLREKDEAIAKAWPKERLRDYIVSRLTAAGYDSSFLSKENRLRLQQGFGPMFRELGKAIGARLQQVDLRMFKSPWNVHYASYEPERRFSELLFQHADLFDAFVRMPNQGGYSFPYSYKPAKTARTHVANENFNPDYFIKVRAKSDVLVVEVKMEGDDSNRNRAKCRDGLKHFETLNERLAAAGEPWRYHFYFLSPEDYTSFFGKARNNGYAGWKSGLMQELV